MTGIELIAQERASHLLEGWTPQHDSHHTEGELALAAVCYAMPPRRRSLSIVGNVPALWPWERQWWKPTPQRRLHELAKAGALIAAEMDRLLAGGDDQ